MVTISDSVTSIGDEAFYECRNLTSITIPDSVTSIGAEAFGSCSSLTSIVVDENNQNYKSIDGNLYSKDGSTLLQYASGKTDTTFTIPDSVTSIGYFAFCNCSSLTSITIPNSVTSIGVGAFAYCDSLTSITIPNGITSIGNKAFDSCWSLTIYCEAESKPEGWDTDWNNDNCPVVWNVQSVFAQDGINYAITKANFATVGKYIGTAIEVTIPSTVTIDGATYTVTTIGDEAFYFCRNLTSITIPDSITSIDGQAFIGCESLTSITIPDSVTSIGAGAFQYCDSLTSIVVDENNQNYKSIDGNLYSKDGTILIQYAIGKTNTSFTIPDSVTSIGNYAFYNCSSLTSVTIPDSVTSIGAEAFSGCSSLSSVTIPNGVTSIVEEAFAWCRNLTSITIPDSVTSLGERAFGWCTSLTSITIPDSVTSIGDYAFYGCSSLTTVTIPDSVTSIGDEALYGCSNLTSITIPDSVTSIGYYAFGGCDSLTIYCEAESKPEGWDGYWNYDSRPVVWNCSYIDNKKGFKFEVINETEMNLIDYTGTASEMTIPNFVENENKIYIVSRIGDGAFNGSDDLERVILKEDSKLSVISLHAFSECTNLISISIPDSIIRIEAYAFSDCTALETIYYQGTLQQWADITFENDTSNPAHYADSLYVNNGTELAGDIKNYAGGHGTLESPYLISNALHLKNVGLNLDSHFALTRDITLSTEWVGIGENGADYKSFTGDFDGRGFSIIGLKRTTTPLYDSNKTARFGLFAKLDGATLKWKSTAL